MDVSVDQGNDRKGLARTGVVFAPGGDPKPSRRAVRLTTSLVDISLAFVLTSVALLATKMRDGTFPGAVPCGASTGAVYASLLAGSQAVAVLGSIRAVMWPHSRRLTYRGMSAGLLGLASVTWFM